MYNFHAIWPEMILGVAGVLFLLLAVSRVGQQPRLAQLLALATSLAALALLPTASHSAQGATLSAMVLVDGVGTFLRASLLLGLILLLLFSGRYVEAQKMPVWEFYSLILIATAGASFMVSAGDMISFYIGFETLSLASYALAGFLRENRFSMEASLKFFLNGAIASAFLLFGFSLAYGLTGTTALAPMAMALGEGPWEGGAGLVPTVALLFVLGGIAFKLSLAPFHLWAPDVYQGAPTAVTAFLSFISKAGALGGFVRVIMEGFAPLGGEWQTLVAVLAAFSMTVGNVAALWQTNLKRLLAYSSIAHAGYILAALSLGPALGLQPLLFYLLAYLFMTLGAFGGVMVLSSQGEGEDLKDLHGLWRRSPLLAGALTIFFLSLLGIPFTAGFMAKLLVIRALVDGHLVWLAVFIAVNTAISAYYYFLPIKAMYVRPAETERPARVPVDFWAGLALAVAVVGVFWLGVLPENGLSWSLFAVWGR
ncbi:MAG: NADH-quinone oxidoreductase subunit N [Bacillota bacterium]|nr:NADH-quinone oxidoreductase subunit N [Bacillota bacterium]